jgi:hypothetical protein
MEIKIETEKDILIMIGKVIRLSLEIKCQLKHGEIHPDHALLDVVNQIKDQVGMEYFDRKVNL